MDKTPAVSASTQNRLLMQRQRRFKDKLANITIGMGGVTVILSILLIFFYLLYEVWPLLKGSDLTKGSSVASTTPSLYLDADEYNSRGLRIQADGQYEVIDAKSGKLLSRNPLPLPEGVTVASIKKGSVLSGLIGFGLSNGQLLVAKPQYITQFDESTNERQVNASLAYPYGEQAISINADGQPLTTFYVRGDESELVVLAKTSQGLERLSFAMSGGEEAGGLSLGLDEESEAGAAALTQTERIMLPYSGGPITEIVLGQDGVWGYVFHDRNQLAIYSLRDEPVLNQEITVAEPGVDVTAVTALLGNVSLIIGDSRGQVSQWFQVRKETADGEEFKLTKIRGIKLGDAPITALTGEPGRKGFVAGDKKGVMSYYYTTSQRLIGQEQVSTTPIRVLSVSPRSQGILVQSEDAFSFWGLESEHPDVSMSSLWSKVWYESYPEAAYTWQSSSGNIDFEGKLSLMPLTFGTFKAAFYAMVLAAPLAIFGAMYTSMFMAPALRRKVKPTIELMGALPTVILGFLAGLWLAPTIEANLPGIFSLLILTPLGILLFGMLWSRLPQEKRMFSEGWTPILLIVPILLIGWFSFAMSKPVEVAFFGGDVRLWLESETGLNFDQRNALIVGLTMGFAVIPSIYSIAEDALFAVPRHLTNGSLALGATQWQTLTRVVLPTASPGIFSAVMIGFGRAIGETMIVLMATGNTAVMDWNIFEGMRTLSANVAVEMGEAEVASTHFRVLFLSAFVLFVLTFVLNTAAEVVRNRLRKKYGSL